MSSSAREDVGDTKVDELEEAALEAETGTSRRSPAFHLRSTTSRSWKRRQTQHAHFSCLSLSLFSLSFFLSLTLSHSFTLHVTLLAAAVQQTQSLRARQGGRGVALLAAKTRRLSLLRQRLQARPLVQAHLLIPPRSVEGEDPQRCALLVLIPDRHILSSPASLHPPTAQTGRDCGCRTPAEAQTRSSAQGQTSRTTTC